MLLRKKVRWAILIAVAMPLVAGIAYAAWRITRQVSTTTQVTATFSVGTLTCEEAVPGNDAPSTCSAVVTNDYDLPMIVETASLSSERTDVTFGGVEVPGVGGLPQVVTPGSSITLQGEWRAGATADAGPVEVTMDVTCSAD